VAQRSEGRTTTQAALLPGSRALRKVGALHTASKTSRALFVRTVMAAAAVDDPATVTKAAAGKERPLKVLVAGGGIGGLMLARALQKKGMDVQVRARSPLLNTSLGVQARKRPEGAFRGHAGCMWPCHGRWVK
jgi:hypothetical protein